MVYVALQVLLCPAIKDHQIIAYNIDLKSETIEESEQECQQKEEENQNGKNITTTSNPNRNRGEVKQQTDIFVNTDECDFTMISVEKYSDIPNIKYIKRKKENDENEVSSGDPNSKKGNKVKRFENTEKKPNRSEIDDFELILSALNHLKGKQDSTLRNFSFVGTSGQTSDGFNLLQISSLVQKPVYLSWIDGIYGRKLLFLELQFRNNDTVAYLIDIHRNKPSEAFCAFFLIMNRKLNSEDVKQICVAIEKSQGRKKWLTECEHLISDSKPLKHMYTTVSEWSNRFDKVFKEVFKD
ncbi:hypothetical protein [uncultured Acinetobacter sp.]|mgnify:FL=1|uniref:hypothetical protein n=1 Tax=uncultured Acinetobacter sp. TaxID=165433 RepID=UPI0025D9ECC4|nr:hypothetical protein [uncultured Acinetobacter sp.]